MILGFDNQVYGDRVANVQNFVPGNAVAGPARSAAQFTGLRAVGVGYLHPPAFYDVAEMRRVKMAFVARARWKSTTEYSLPDVVVQLLANGFTHPAGGKGVGQITGKCDRE